MYTQKKKIKRSRELEGLIAGEKAVARMRDVQMTRRVVVASTRTRRTSPRCTGSSPTPAWCWPRRCPSSSPQTAPCASSAPGTGPARRTPEGGQTNDRGSDGFSMSSSTIETKDDPLQMSQSNWNEPLLSRIRQYKNSAFLIRLATLIVCWLSNTKRMLQIQKYH